ncbi:TTF-type zinc finger protein with HAT dimerization domain [Abeliophyllum distichum]|uniref:TTF-type zinc finger protein with HAT dimerization domain n=1 Tax=Abeliophyllum distichum TaxID=126358 RepID=A0ABD1PWV2_9LAMI
MTSSPVNFEDTNEEGANCIDSNGTKVRILFNDLASNSNARDGCEPRKLMKKDKGNNFLFSKKKKDNSSLQLLLLDPRNSFESFNGDDICKLAEKFYPDDFTQQDVYSLRYELQHYQYDVIPDPRFQVPSLSELCKLLVTSRRSESYIMLIRLIRLVLTLLVSTATTERAFSTMKHVKTAIRNRMEDEFLADCMTLYIEREFAEKIDVDSIIDEFYAVKARKIQLQ